MHPTAIYLLTTEVVAQRLREATEGRRAAEARHVDVHSPVAPRRPLRLALARAIARVSRLTADLAVAVDHGVEPDLERPCAA
jgi:hypothetical protein